MKKFLPCRTKPWRSVILLFYFTFYILHFAFSQNPLIKQWDKKFGGTGTDQLYSIKQTKDGGYILGELSYSDSSGEKTQPTWGTGSDYWIVKIDASGNKQWDRDYGGTIFDALYSIEQTSDGGFILGGFSYSGISGDKTEPTWGSADYWIIKIDSLGIKQWDKDFGGTLPEDEFGNIFQTDDGGYLVSGTSYSDSSGDKTENNLGQEQIWVVKTDSLGSKQWDKTIFTTGHDEIGYGIQTTEGCYVMANYTSAGIGGYKTEANWDSVGNITSDYWIIKFCDSTSTTSINPISDFQFPISISPNPFTSDITITIQKQFIYKGSFTIKNVLGKTVYSNQLQTPNSELQTTLDLSFLSKGIYLIEATIAPQKDRTGGEWIVKKIVKQ